MSTNNNKTVDKAHMPDSCIETLITLVEGKKELWATGDPVYKASAAKKAEEWEKIGKVVKVNGTKCSNKWKNVLQAFRKEFSNAPKTRSGDAASNYEPSFKWYNRMQFVLDHVTPRKSTGNCNRLLSKSKNRYEDQSSDELSHDDEDEESSDQLKTYADLLHTSHKHNGPVATTSSDYHDDEKKTLAQMKEHEHFVRSIVPRITHFSDVETLLFRGELKELIIKYAYQEKGLYAQNM